MNKNSSNVQTVENKKQNQVIEDLINVFNTKVSSLKESYERLQQQVSILTTELEKKKKELEEKNKLALIGEMAACIAHEIRNPLGGISLYVEMLLNKENLRRDVVVLVEKINLAVKNIDRLIQDMLNLSSELNLTFSVFSVEDILNECLYLLKEKLETKNIRVEKKYNSSKFVVQADRGYLMRAFNNIILNAIEAVDNNGKIEVIVSNLNVDSCIVSIKDNGVGIPQDVRDKLFTPFFTTKSKGIGLGLAITKKIIDKHGGRIFISNNNGEKGTCVNVILPLFMKL